MTDKMIKKQSFTGKKVEILGETYEPGMPAEKGQWRKKLRNRKAMLKYLQSGERYWYLDADQWCGSERRKSKA
ncbi:MAG: hypothetical protein HWN68_06805 [Desulfobacterales bacterium]|nr:hypothetical protein [Desulfobacterales bacterium]